jgi:hypothetical protein
MVAGTPVFKIDSAFPDLVGIDSDGR